MKKLLILTIALALMAGVFASCFDGKPTPTPTPTEVAPGSYIPLYNVGTVTSGTWNAASISYLYIGNMTSAQFAVRISDETGSGVIVFGTSPSITTPTIATPTITGTLIGGAFTTITSGAWNGTSIAYTYEGSRTSAQQAVVLSDETGTGLVVYGTSPTITTPTITTPTLTNAVGSGTWTGGAGTWTIPAFTVTSPTITTPTITTPTITGSTSMYAITSGTWNATSVAYTYEADRTSAQQALRISDETGSGLLVFGTSPTITTPTITTPTVATPTFTGGLLIATTAFSGGTGVIVLGNGAAPSAMNSTIQLYATGGKLYAMDSAGTITQLTP